MWFCSDEATSSVAGLAAVAAAGPLDERSVDLIRDEKRRIIRQSGALELYPYEGGLAQVGGLQELKKWLELRRCAFKPEAREHGLPVPKGVARAVLTTKSASASMMGSRSRSVRWNL